MQLTTPSEPAMAVSTAINTLSNLLQSMGPLPPPSPKREGAADPNGNILLFDMMGIFEF